MGNKHIGLALSGGGHRATIFALGALLYLVDSGRNLDVRLITSVSGGSITNAWLSLLPKSLNQLESDADKKEFETYVAEFSRQIAGNPCCWKFTVYTYFLSYLIWIAPEVFESLTWSWSFRSFLFGTSFFILAFGIGPRSGGTLWGSGIWWGYVGLVIFGIIAGLVGSICSHLWGIGLILIALTLWFTLAPHMASYAFGKTISVQSNDSESKTNALVTLQAKKKADSSATRHIYCATQLQIKRHFYMSGEFVYSHFYGSGKPGPIRLCDAVQASANFPFIFPGRIYKPEIFHFSPLYKASQENASPIVQWFSRRKLLHIDLIDGGVYDNTGFAWFEEGAEIQEKLNSESRLLAVYLDALKLNQYQFHYWQQLYGENYPQKGSSYNLIDGLFQSVENLLANPIWEGFKAFDSPNMINDLCFLRRVWGYVKKDCENIQNKTDSQETILPKSLQTRITQFIPQLNQFLKDFSIVQDDISKRAYHINGQELVKYSLSNNLEVIVINSSDPFLLKPGKSQSTLNLFQFILKPFRNIIRHVKAIYDIPYAKRLSTIAEIFLRQTPFKGGIVSITDSPIELARHVMDTYHGFSDPAEMHSFSPEENLRSDVEDILRKLQTRNRYPIYEKPTTEQYRRALTALFQGQDEFIQDAQISEEECQQITEARETLDNYIQESQEKLVRLQAKLDHINRFGQNSTSHQSETNAGPLSTSVESLKLQSYIHNILEERKRLTSKLKGKIKEIRSRREGLWWKVFYATIEIMRGTNLTSKVDTTLRPLGPDNTALLLHHGYYSAMLNLYTLCDGYKLILNGPTLLNFQTLLKKGDLRGKI